MNKAIDIIENKSLTEIKEIFQDDYYLKNEVLVHFKDIVKYLIDQNNNSFYTIKYLLNQHYHYNSYHLYHPSQVNPDYEDLLFYAIEYTNFEVAKLFMRYGSRMAYLDENEDYHNILEYLSENCKLHRENLHFILKMNRDTSLITNRLLCNLISGNKFELLQIIFHYDYYDSSVIDTLLFHYKNKSMISSYHLHRMIHSDREIIRFNEETSEGFNPLFCAIDSNHCEVVQLLLNYALENHLILDLNAKDADGNTPFLQAVYRNNTRVVHLLMEYAQTMKMTLALNEENDRHFSPLLYGIRNKNFEMIRLLFHYADQTGMALKIREVFYEADYTFHSKFLLLCLRHMKTKFIYYLKKL